MILSYVTKNDAIYVGVFMNLWIWEPCLRTLLLIIWRVKEIHFLLKIGQFKMNVTEESTRHKHDWINCLWMEYETEY